MESQIDKNQKNKKQKKDNKSKNKIIDKKVCEKCKENKSKIYNRNKYLCQDCFNEMIICKFKSNLYLVIILSKNIFLFFLS